ncbi:MAG TPA: hypothetical protein VFI11_06230 [Anaerolineales bacterium]|nr:hypothetical protein [Anaerolineales bacterium]
MTGTPAFTIDEGFIRGLVCPICAARALSVQHVDRFPDFVSCGNCRSAFVVEDTGERVMYGKIPPDYPDTAAFALKQWVWLEAVGRRAEAERPRPVPVETPAVPAFQPEAESQPEIPADVTEKEPEPAWLSRGLRSDEALSAGVPIPTEPEPPRAAPPAVVLAPESEALPEWLREPESLRDETPPAPPPLPIQESPPAPPPLPIQETAASPVTPEAPAPAILPGEPDKEGVRTRVILRGEKIRFPINACAHCLRTPAPARLPVAGSLPRPSNLGGRRPATFRIPLCASCRKRAAARSSDQGSGRLQAHLLAALVALTLVVAALALNLVSFQGSGLGALAALGVLAGLGYALTAFVLSRGGAPVPPDALFVRTTLLVRGSPLSPETVFAWRNAEYAEIFHLANQSAAVSGPTPTDEDADIV